MKKAFELFLVLIIFYGVYTAFDQAAPIFFENTQAIWVAAISLLAAILLLVLYSWIIASTAKRKLKETLSDLEKEITAKDVEIKSATSFKETLIKEAEETITRENIN
jgi:predicted membrane protein